jgi:hypothetical protein
MTAALCIGCGCDDRHACNALFGVGCWWLRFDATEGAGVCSCCQDLLADWDNFGRAPRTDLIADRFWRQATFMYENEASARAWMAAPQQLLGGRTPRELVLEGKIADVQRVLDQLRAGAYV